MLLAIWLSVPCAMHTLLISSAVEPELQRVYMASNVCFGLQCLWAQDMPMQQEFLSTNLYLGSFKRNVYTFEAGVMFVY